MIKKGILFFVTFVITLLVSVGANAYTFTEDFQMGFYWSSFPVQMGIYAHNESEASLLQEIVMESEAEWEDSTGENIWNFSDAQVSKNYSNNHIRWSVNFAQETGFDPYQTIGVTIRYNRGTFFEKVVIILNSELSYLRQNYGNSLKKAILHEMGHIIALGHTDKKAIMYPYLSSTDTLQSDDVNGANAVVGETLYRQRTGYIAPVVARQMESESESLSCGSSAFASDKHLGNKLVFSNIISVFFGLVFGILCRILFLVCLKKVK
ncbi:MAG: matrixin family metalloprotease [Bacteriovoracaceae bacterium]|nr:matrixin family metalloprotease [Bacteriovoracaceae bacterium]